MARYEGEIINASQVLFNSTVDGLSSAITIPNKTAYVTITALDTDRVWVCNASGDKLLLVPQYYSGESNSSSFVSLELQGTDIKVETTGSAQVYVTRFFSQ